MKFGIISDIHANKVALEAVLEDMPTVDYLICCGDIVGYGPHPSECVRMVREQCDIIIKGNHDRDLESPERYIHNHMAYEGLQHALEELSKEQFDWITSLPEQMDLPNQFVAVHSHPTIQDKYVRPKDFEDLSKFSNLFEGLFLGHTHIQHAEMVNGAIIVNSGSVGQPRDDNTSASYATLDVDNTNVKLHRVDYDIDSVVEDIHKNNLPERTATRLKQGW